MTKATGRLRQTDPPVAAVAAAFRAYIGASPGDCRRESGAWSTVSDDTDPLRKVWSRFRASLPALADVPVERVCGGPRFGMAQDMPVIESHATQPRTAVRTPSAGTGVM